MNSSPDQTADLWLRIDQLHLNYLKSENNTKKLDIRKKLEGKKIEVKILKCCISDMHYIITYLT